MKIMLEPANQFKSINIVNSFVKENIKLQNEVFRVQKKLITLLHNQTQSRLNKASFLLFKYSQKEQLLTALNYLNLRKELSLESYL